MRGHRVLVLRPKWPDMAPRQLRVLYPSTFLLQAAFDVGDPQVDHYSIDNFSGLLQYPQIQSTRSRCRLRQP